MGNTVRPLSHVQKVLETITCHGNRWHHYSGSIASRVVQSLWKVLIFVTACTNVSDHARSDPKKIIFGATKEIFFAKQGIMQTPSTSNYSIGKSCLSNKVVITVWKKKRIARNNKKTKGRLHISIQDLLLPKNVDEFITREEAMKIFFCNRL